MELAMKKIDTFVDLGVGWFIEANSSFLEYFVLDALAPVPDCTYGPAAWAGNPGPARGLLLVSLVNVSAGSPTEAGPWPAVAHVTLAGVKCGLDVLEGVVFANENEFATALVRIVSAHAKRELPVVPASERVAVFSLLPERPAA
jgi:hypothetical protein